MTFEIYPAIDLQDGRVVRLQQGDINQKEVFPKDPLEYAKEFAKAGARWVHVVDIKAATTGLASNFNLIAAIKRETGLKVEYGGGLRDEDSLAAAIKAGADRAILGTIATRNRVFPAWAALQYPGRIAIGIDARDGMVSVDGWNTHTHIPADDFAHQMEQMGACAIIFTDIARDGMGNGVNTKMTLAIADCVGDIPVIASGGIGNIDHVKQVAALEDDGIQGVVIGRAYYKGDISLPDALKLSHP